MTYNGGMMRVAADTRDTYQEQGTYCTFTKTRMITITTSFVDKKHKNLNSLLKHINIYKSHKLSILFSNMNVS